jgi:N4-gp56 family major capsid protein
LVPYLKRLADPFGNKAFIEIQHYADAGTIMNGEVGSVDKFRIIQVPEMLHWAGAGAAVGTNPGYRASMVGGAQHYDVFPMLVVGDDSFATIGFQTDGKTLKFNILTKMPGRETADRNEPYGETGFTSIKWYYGILVKRPERIALVKTVAPL